MLRLFSTTAIVAFSVSVLLMPAESTTQSVMNPAAQEWFDEAMKAFLDENYPKAAELFEQSLDKDPNNVDILCWLAKSEAYELGERAKRGASRLSLLPQGRRVQNLYTRAYEMDPDNLSARLGYAVLLRDIPDGLLGGDVDKAEEILKSILEEDPTYVLAYHHLGNLYIRKRGQIDFGIHFLRRALEIAESKELTLEEQEYLGNTYHALGKALLEETSDAEAAIPFLEKSSEMDPSNIVTLIDLTAAYKQLNRDEDARKTLAKAVELAKERDYRYFYRDLRQTARALGMSREINL